MGYHARWEMDSVNVVGFSRTRRDEFFCAVRPRHSVSVDVRGGQRVEAHRSDQRVAVHAAQSGDAAQRVRHVSGHLRRPLLQQGQVRRQRPEEAHLGAAAH